MKTEYQSLTNDLKQKNIQKNKYDDKIKSLNHKKAQLVRKIEDIVSEDSTLVVPDPESIVVYMEQIE